MPPNTFEAEIFSFPHTYTKLTFGTVGIKKLGKVISTYKIPDGEQIIAYMKGTIPLLGLMTEETIITDHALYIHPCHDDWAATNRFPFSEICRYTVYMKGPKSDVCLARGEQVNTILGCTIFGKSVGGMELTQFIRSLQVVLLEKYDWAQEQKKRSIQQLFATVRTSMKHGRISDDQLMMLDNFGLAGNDSFSAKLLRAEDLYRSCDFESYDGFVNALPYEEKKKVIEKQEEFSKDLRQDLSDPKGTFDSEYLTSAHQNLSSVKRAAPSEKIIFCYLCIRLDRRVEYRLEKESLARCDPEGAREAEDFLHCFRNCRMNEVYHAVRLGEKLDPAWYDWQDDLGLTVLRYAPADDKPDIDLAEYEEKYGLCIDKMHETKEHIRELKESIYEIGPEIEELTASLMAQATDMAHDLSTSADPFLHFLYQFYIDPALREHILKDCAEGSILYSYLGSEFAVPADIFIDLPHRTAQIYSSGNREDDSCTFQQHAQQDSPIVRPFGDCWFSPTARQSMKVLKEEYHRLAKQYHPDICNDRRGQQIFQEILNERMEILEQMAQ